MDKIVGKKRSYLAMKTDSVAANELISSDLKEIGNTVKKLANHAVKLGSLGFGTIFLKWIASFAAIYLLIIDRTNWKTNILMSLLIPYIFLSLPSLIFNVLRGEIGKWIALIAVVLRLFFPRHFPDWVELSGALILLIVVAPSFFAGTIRDNWIGILICLVIGCYLLQEHIRASGGSPNSMSSLLQLVLCISSNNEEFQLALCKCSYECSTIRCEWQCIERRVHALRFCD